MMTDSDRFIQEMNEYTLEMMVDQKNALRDTLRDTTLSIAKLLDMRQRIGATIFKN